MQNGRVELETELMDLSTGSTLWNGHYSETLTGVLLLQRKLIEGVVKALRVTPDGSFSLSTLPPALNPEAYRLILRGRHALKRPTERSLRSAIGLFTEASAKDSRSPAALAGLAESYNAMTQRTVAAMKPHEAFLNTKKAARKALELDKQLAGAHLALGVARMVDDWDWPGAGTDFDRALQLQASDPIAHLRRAQWLMDTGRSENALAEARTAATLDPWSPTVSLDLGWMLYLARRYVEAIEQLKAAVSLDPASPAAHWALGMAYEKADRFDDAVRELEAANTTSGSKPLYLAGVGYAYARAGRVREATQVLERVRGTTMRVDFPPFDVAILALALDHHDAAFKWLGQAIDDRAPAVTSLAIDPRLDPLRSDLRFKSLLKRIGL